MNVNTTERWRTRKKKLYQVWGIRSKLLKFCAKLWNIKWALKFSRKKKKKPTYCRHGKKINWLKIQDMIGLIVSFVLLSSFQREGRKKIQPFQYSPVGVFSVRWQTKQKERRWRRKTNMDVNCKKSSYLSKYISVRFFWDDENSNSSSFETANKLPMKRCCLSWRQKDKFFFSCQELERKSHSL